ncbi:MAG: hypothetical protein HOH66_12800 [Rhodospirillaceae bacterium]|jgi:hypothetical protein|nr:hypothetical protein [Rhodospirillaceae bacterium]
MTTESPLLGVMQLQNTPVTVPGSMGHADSYDAPVVFRRVPGAWTSNVVGEGRELVPAYIETARALEAEGCTALVTNCGFTARFQKDVAAAVAIPVAMSSLLMVPWAASLLPPGKKLGIVTYDSNQLTEVHFNGAGWSRKTMPVEIVGIEGSESWHRMADPDTKLDRAMVERDVLAATRGMLAAHPEISSIVLECSAFPLAGDAVRRETGLPTVHFVTMANMLIRSAAPSPRAARAAAE